MTAPARFRQADIKRLFAGAKSAGYERVRVTFDSSGNFVVDAWESKDDEIDGGNEWDVVLSKA